jgi:two-component system nitrogen regulation response regulator GlnG
MTHSKSDASTVGLSGTGRLPAVQRGRTHPASVPVLTLLYHPDLRRVGERALLSELPLGREVRLGRQEPELSPPDATAGEPLADRHISRQPLLLRPTARGGIVLSARESRTRVVADGVPLTAELAISAADLARGVVLELADRVVLLLHVLDHLTAPAAKRFGLVGDSGGIARVRDEIGSVAGFDVPVLLRGETGTGKELAARALHDASRRRSGPFVAVNLGAIPPTLVASELFGAVRGAYTGSVQSQEGYFRKAHGGTLLLDEVGEATPEVQVMLLRTLETGEVHAVGTQSPQRVDVRVLAATDADLEARVAAGELRAPLLHRLGGYEIWLPPLRERRDDIGRLLVHFLRRELAALGAAHLLEPGAPLWLPAGLVARLALYHWPGNVRQLRNVARQIAIGSRSRPRAEIGPAVERLLSKAAPRPAEPPKGPAAADPTAAHAERRRPADVSEAELIEALHACRWDLQAAAERLRISRPSLYALVEANPRLRKAGDLSPEEIARCWEECGGDVEAMVDRLEVSRKALARRLRELKLT